MKLVVFDLDGTLTQTMGVDGECFVIAVTEVLQLPEIDQNWNSYEHVTDEGVIRELFARRFGRKAQPNDTLPIVDRLIELLGARHLADGSAFSEIAGATPLINRLRGDSQWSIALATGAWRRSAEFKIRSAGLPLSGIPAAFAEDGPSREGIVRAAIDRAKETYRQPEFERIVSVGDALWDVKTARNLRFPFLGVGASGRAERLRSNGVSHVLEDYRDPERFLRYLEEARIP